MKVRTFAAAALLWLAAAGCQCCRLTECGMCALDTFDYASEHRGKLDCLYCPWLDANRIGMPDGCRCSVEGD